MSAVEHIAESIFESDLIRRAVKNAGHDSPRRVRWAHVRDLFCTGATTAIALCRRFEIDPDEEIGKDYQTKEDEDHD